ncbi:SDR family NAD(P)-dependent oxidoreductase [Oricola sp.]|uniref:SDR family NAD(P)-dependent oxidoreductase n=1 Tax=Oricola sp. TaxID=1979950 RepID=UPI0025E03013|nr:SDR family NAD(P)-dependent oxidoreductase [Oricola sp.]MCI5077872.1 SDR family NAD(P)-dependent oxidoreductase [Oricola sp.]
MPEFKGKTVLVTGASRGIGKALVDAFAGRGAHVIAAARTVTEDGATPHNSPQVTWIACDVARAEDRRQLIDSVRKTGRPLDILINNAGIQQALDLTGGDPDQALCGAIETELAVNLTAPACLATACVPLMARPGGTIVNVTSLVAIQAKASAPAYSASKAGLQRFTEALRQQLEPLGIHVLEAVPPLVDTAMTAGRGKGKLSPEEMAAAIIRGLETGAGRVAPGIGRVVIALKSLSPALLTRLMGTR